MRRNGRKAQGGNGAAPVLRVLNSLPRSGTHWVKNMIAGAMGRKPLARRLLEAGRLEAALDRDASRRLIFDHFDYDLHGSVLDRKARPGLRMIFLCRHPADALISGFHLLASQRRLPDNRLGAMENFKLYLRGHWKDRPLVRRVRENRLFAMSLRDYVRRSAADWVRLGRSLCVRYEDLVSRPHRELARILDYLEVPRTADTVARAVEANCFEVLSGGRSPGTVDPRSHYRKGVPGEWRETLDREDVRILAREIGDSLDVLGYSLRGERKPRGVGPRRVS
jgi:hypothetical protein